MDSVALEVSFVISNRVEAAVRSCVGELKARGEYGPAPKTRLQPRPGCGMALTPVWWTPDTLAVPRMEF